MSQSRLNLRDIESWLAAPATTEGGAGFISKLFTAIHRSMVSLAKIHSIMNQGGFDQCRNDSERFFLWGDGLSITDGDLDETLERTKEVRFRVLSLLLETMLQEMEPDEFIREAPGSESDSSESETPDIVAEISTYVDCLLDMAPVLENPAIDIDMDWPDKPPGRTKEKFTVSSDEALIYCRRIRDRFESAPKYLVERLAEANVIRAATLRELQVQPVESVNPIRDDITESLFSRKSGKNMYSMTCDPTYVPSRDAQIQNLCIVALYHGHSTNLAMHHYLRAASSARSVPPYTSMNAVSDDDDDFETDESDLELAPLESGDTLPIDTGDDNAMTQPIAGDQATGETDPRVDETAEPQGITPQPPVTGSDEYQIDLDSIIDRLLEIVGDMYGQYYDLLRHFEYGGFPTEANYLFLAIIEEKIFCMHGGLSPDLNVMEQIRRIMRPFDVPDEGLICDLLWSDPDKDITGWGENNRGISFAFGPDVVSRFLQKHDLDLIVRGHQVVEGGYEFFSDRKLVTLWGAPNWRGEYDNAGAIMNVDESLLCSFQIIPPAKRKQNLAADS
ncbi:hypothetical protein DL765_010585 [Monosporascus sp. GIB2]|nr:hypothetical protein DL765_010585 [Monosporascus sp. GIB2]